MKEDTFSYDVMYRGGRPGRHCSWPASYGSRSSPCWCWNNWQIRARR